MSYYKKHVLSCIAIGALSLSFANEDYEDSHETKTQPVALITPSAAPIVNHGFDVFLFGDFIYWSARVDGVQSTFTNQTFKNSINQAITISDDSDETRTSHFHLKPGFKAGIGMNFEHDGWDSLARYTWFRTHANTNSHGTNLVTFKTAGNTTIFDGVGIGTIDWKLHFNALDWELGRNYYISPKLLLRPFFGLKGTWMTQYLSSYTSTLEKDTSNPPSENSSQYSSQVNEKLDFWGVGIRPGLQTSWQLSSQWSIFGDLALSALWGQFKNTEKEHLVISNLQDTANSGEYDSQQFAGSFHTITPVLEFALGLRWDYKFSDDDYRVRLQAGWEEQVWFNQNQFLYTREGYAIPGSNFGNLVMQGLTVEFRFDF